MTTSHVRRHRGGGSHLQELSIKQEMDASHSSEPDHDEMGEHLNGDDLRSAASNMGASTAMRRADHGLRNGRSDARKSYARRFFFSFYYSRLV